MSQIRKSLSSMTVELVIVIVGILMAISIDSWWQDRHDRIAEQALLHALRTEFQANAAELDLQFTWYENRFASVEELLRLGPAATDLPADSLAAVWTWVFRGGTYDPATGVLTSAMASGEIALIEDRDLRRTLAAWQAKMDNFHRVETIVENLIFEQFMPWVRERTALPDALGEGGMPLVRGQPDYLMLSESVVVENFLRELQGWGVILRFDRGQVKATIDEVLAGIDRNLDP